MVSPGWEAIWIIGGTSFPRNLEQDPRWALGIVDRESATGTSLHVGLRGRAEVLPFAADIVRAILRKYLGPDEAARDRRFDAVARGEGGIELVRLLPETVVMRDQSYRRGTRAREARGAQA